MSNGHNGSQVIPVELLLSKIGEQVHVNIEERRRWLQGQIAARRQRLAELEARRDELQARATEMTDDMALDVAPPPAFDPLSAAEEIGGGGHSDQAGHAAAGDGDPFGDLLTPGDEDGDDGWELPGDGPPPEGMWEEIGGDELPGMPADSSPPAGAWPEAGDVPDDEADDLPAVDGLEDILGDLDDVLGGDG